VGNWLAGARQPYLSRFFIEDPTRVESRFHHFIRSLHDATPSPSLTVTMTSMNCTSNEFVISSDAMKINEKGDMKYHLLSSNPGERQQLIEHVSSTTRRQREDLPREVHRPRSPLPLRIIFSRIIVFCFVTTLTVVITGSLNVIIHWYDHGAVVSETTKRSADNEILPPVADSALLRPEGPTIMASCHEEPCYNMANIHVPLQSPGFPSFLDYAHTGAIHVSYDSRSLILNGERVFFLGGSMHPARATQQTWNMALNEAVLNGLNLITIYVMWADHQPFPDQAINWSFEQGLSCRSMDQPTETCVWSLATAIRSAADRGLFVHLRLGPYVSILVAVMERASGVLNYSVLSKFFFSQFVGTLALNTAMVEYLPGSHFKVPE
jgi:Glycosyl hydrolases family 35